MLIFLLTFCCFFYNYIKVIADSFYIFDVGQGNCQLAIFKEEGIGILYDCGSNSIRKPTKFIPIIKEENWIQIYQKKTENLEIPQQFVSIEDLEESDEQLQINLLKQSESQEDSQSMSNSFVSEIEISIKNYLEKLKHLFIILSHPDQDHINLINSGTIPQDVPITVLCEGDWFRHNTKEVKEVLNFLKKRPVTHYYFPFYEGLLEKERDKILKEFLYDNDDFLNVFSLRRKYKCSPYFYVETMEDVLFKSLAVHKNPSNKTKILQNIKIAHINFPFNDINSQSAIVEIKMPKLGMQFFLTGDASNETFARIVDKNEKFFKKEKEYTSLVMFPHHGSINNESNWIYELFQPDIIGISAGNGGQFEQPSKKLIDSIKYPTSFFNKFKVTMNQNFFVYYKKKKAYLHKVLDTSIPYVCTNFLGTIKIDENGFFSQFSNVVEYKNQKYSIDFNKSAKVEYELSDEDELLIKRDFKLYFPVKVNCNCLYLYEVIELTNKIEEEISELERELSGVGYRIQDVPGDGNCAFWAILVAKGKISQEELDKLMSVWDKIKREKGYCPNWSECDKTISAEIPEAVEKMVNLREDCGLNDLGVWTGDENLQQISGAIKRPIILVQRAEGSLAYTFYDENNNGTILEEQNIRDHNSAIFIYYADNHFQALVLSS